MKREAWLGCVFMFIGALILMSNVTITGAVIGPGIISEASFIGLLIFAIGGAMVARAEKHEDSLETFLTDDEVRVMDSETTSVGKTGRGKGMRQAYSEWNEVASKNATDYVPAFLSNSYRRLVHRLGAMEKDKSIGTNSGEPTGVYLKTEEAKELNQEVRKYFPHDFLEGKDSVVIGGSLSPEKKGVRQPKFGMKDSLKSDELYVSDVDVSIYSPKLFKHLNAVWPEVIKKSGDGRGNGEETYRIIDSSFLTGREGKMGYMANAPSWVDPLVKDMASKEILGRKRPVNIKVYNRESY